MTGMIRIQIPNFFEIGIPEKEENVENHFDSPRYHALNNLRWVFNCWLVGIIGSKESGGYGKGAPRRVETNRKIQAVLNALRPHLDDEEWYQLRKGLLHEETGEPFDLDGLVNIQEPKFPV